MNLPKEMYRYDEFTYANLTKISVHRQLQKVVPECIKKKILPLIEVLIKASRMHEISNHNHNIDL